MSFPGKPVPSRCPVKIFKGDKVLTFLDKNDPNFVSNFVAILPTLENILSLSTEVGFKVSKASSNILSLQ